MLANTYVIELFQSDISAETLTNITSNYGDLDELRQEVEDTLD